jgi:hypothetical protein
MRRLVMLMLVGGCVQPAATSAPPPINPTPPTHRNVDPDALCKRMHELQDNKCGMFGDMMIGATCPQEVSGSLGDTRSRPMTEQVDTCTHELSQCSDITACLGQIDTTAETRECTDHSDRSNADAVGLPYAAWRADMKRGLDKFSAVVSSKAKPIELCGVKTENYWMTSLVCNDGSHPLTKRSDAEKARVGNVGGGGKCGSIIDRYQVRCPERTYDVYIDGFVCPEAQQ